VPRKTGNDLEKSDNRRCDGAPGMSERRKGEPEHQCEEPWRGENDSYRQSNRNTASEIVTGNRGGEGG
jgi:hypothetical protein